MLLSLLVAGALADDAADAAFARIVALEGRWRAEVDGGAVEVELAPYANGSAVLETFTTVSGRRTLTVYHPDGDRLLLVHYCGMGNQPRLGTPRRPEALAFRFLDATNLRRRRDAHLAEVTLVETPSGFTKTEVYTEGREREVTVLSFERVE